MNQFTIISWISKNFSEGEIRWYLCIFLWKVKNENVYIYVDDMQKNLANILVEQKTIFIYILIVKINQYLSIKISNPFWSTKKK